MSPQQPNAFDHDETDTKTLPRRRVLAIGAGVGVTLLAGCAGDTSEAPETGEFRLLVSDQPTDIGDFDSLDVTFDDARIFEAGTETTTENGTATEAPAGTTTENGTTTEAPAETTAGSEGTVEDVPSLERVQKSDGFYILDLDGEKVDLTQVVGEDATPVFEGELEPGEYTKIELNVAEVDGVVNGETVDVKVPSEKLQITQSFEVNPDEPVEFVFDINVIKRGPTNGYNLTPVISESGVAGRDVEYNEVPRNGTARNN